MMDGVDIIDGDARAELKAMAQRARTACHALGLATSDAPWEYTKVEIEHHIEEMEIIQNTQYSRLQCLCGLYCYLRDGQLNNWHSNLLQYK